MAEVELRLLRRDDDRSGFRCGEPALDRFFQHYAGHNQFKLHLAVTWVAARGSELLGFATVAGGSLERKTAPGSLPVLRLARLGVDRRAQGMGIGTALVRHVLRLALAQRDQVGCVGVVTDAKTPAVSFYETLGFRPLEGVREGMLHGDPLPMFLSIQTIAAAVRVDPLERVLADPDVTDVRVRGHDHVEVERKGRLVHTRVRFDDDAHLRRYVDRLVQQARDGGTLVEGDGPTFSGSRPDGSTFEATLPSNGPASFSLRLRR